MSARGKVKQSQKKNDKLQRKLSPRVYLSSSYTSKRWTIRLEIKMGKGSGQKYDNNSRNLKIQRTRKKILLDKKRLRLMPRN